MTDLTVELGSTVALNKSSFDKLLEELRKMGYQTIGPKIIDTAVGYAEITGLADLPRGYISHQEAGKYRLVHTGHSRYFDITPGAQSWKQFFFPPRAVLFSTRRTNGAWTVQPDETPSPAYAMIGVRACELSAILVQDRVFLRDEWSDPIYRTRRQNAFIVAINCLHPGDTCFCASMGTGPEAETGYDLCLTELDDVFLVKVGSEAGRMVMVKLPCQPASAFLLQAAHKGLEDARRHMGRQVNNTETLPETLLNNLEHPRWNVVASRCLGCANCNQVCPTCFCWDSFEQPDLSGSSSQRIRVWDSCFNPDYSYVVGGNTRANTRARYRQWLTHKFASWKHQFDVLGCVGCGRCITWCPAGIDVTEEIAAICEEKLS